ncbi:MAG: RNA 2',3'-cyclic phosphodiesterase [Pyrinomonadaceae bacterium]
MKRIFVAIDISDEVQRKVSDYIAALRVEFPKLRVGWEKPEKLHLTMKFLGDINDEQLEKLTKAAEKTARQTLSFKLQVSDTGVFPSARNARILWLGLQHEQGSLQKLNEILETECEMIGFARENRSFKAHLTIARLREPQKSKELVQRHLQNEFEAVEFELSEVVIYESKLLPQGSIYSVISKHLFSGQS